MTFVIVTVIKQVVEMSFNIISIFGPAIISFVAKAYPLITARVNAPLCSISPVKEENARSAAFKQGIICNQFVKCYRGVAVYLNACI